MQLNCGGKALDLRQPVVMGVLNITPDSFSDGGRYVQRDAALRHATTMCNAGAAIIDVGGESTRPGARQVSIDEELERVIPIIERLSNELPIPVSVDTSKPEVMREAARVGAGMINDVWALRRPDALSAAIATGLPVCLMHMLGDPTTMQQRPFYLDVVSEVHTFLAERVQMCVAAGLAEQQIFVDPGFGFGKSLGHNLLLLRHLARFADLGAGVIAGISRKSMLGLLTDTPVEQRLAGSVAAAVLAAWQGARIIRAHDVRETVQALQVCHAVRMLD